MIALYRLTDSFMVTIKFVCRITDLKFIETSLTAVFGVVQTYKILPSIKNVTWVSLVFHFFLSFFLGFFNFHHIFLWACMIPRESQILFECIHLQLFA